MINEIRHEKRTKHVHCHIDLPASHLYLRFPIRVTITVVSLRSKSGVKFATFRGGKIIMGNAPIILIEPPVSTKSSWPYAVCKLAPVYLTTRTRCISLCTNLPSSTFNPRLAQCFIHLRAGELWLNRVILTSVSVWCWCSWRKIVLLRVAKTLTLDLMNSYQQKRRIWCCVHQNSSDLRSTRLTPKRRCWFLPT